MDSTVVKRRCLSNGGDDLSNVHSQLGAEVLNAATKQVAEFGSSFRIQWNLAIQVLACSTLAEPKLLAGPFLR